MAEFENTGDYKLKRIVKTSDNTYYADTKPARKKEKKKAFGDADELTEKELSEQVEEIVAKGGNVEETAAKLAGLLGKNETRRSEISDIRSTTGHNPHGNIELENFNEKTPIIMEIEKSLINYLTRKQDVDKMVQGGSRKIRGLSFSVEVFDSGKDNFTVQIGVCEATFAVDTGLKEIGSIFGLERFIRDWALLTSVNDMIKQAVYEKRQEISKKQKKLFKRK